MGGQEIAAAVVPRFCFEDLFVAVRNMYDTF
jgi:hypothetical protein